MRGRARDRRPPCLVRYLSGSRSAPGSIPGPAGRDECCASGGRTVEAVTGEADAGRDLFGARLTPQLLRRTGRRPTRWALRPGILCPRQCPGSGHRRQVSQVIGDTVVTVDGWRCRRHAWSLPRWSWSTSRRLRSLRGTPAPSRHPSHHLPITAHNRPGTRPQQRHPRPRPPRQDRQRRRGHPPPGRPPAPHRRRTNPRPNPRHPARPGPARPHHRCRDRRTTPRPHHRPPPRLPAHRPTTRPRTKKEIARTCTPQVRAIPMSRDITWCPRQDSNLRHPL